MSHGRPDIHANAQGKELTRGTDELFAGRFDLFLGRSVVGIMMDSIERGIVELSRLTCRPCFPRVIMVGRE